MSVKIEHPYDPRIGPLVWPVCPECKTPCVLRHCLSFASNYLDIKWLWQRDCKHKGKKIPMEEFILYNEKGPIPDAP